MNLYQPIYSRFERFCRARVYGEMEHGDLMNETLLVAFEKFEDLKNEQAFLSFLCGISIRILSNSNRKKKPLSGLDSHLNAASSGADTDQRTDIGILHEALSQLPTEQKESLILFEISGFPIKEIAEIQGVGESAVKQRLRRGRIRLAEILLVNKDMNAEKKAHHEE
ncbi:MAG: sigma-70 family RNA polymerase sigma factor [Bacteroidota bacterium]